MLTKDENERLTKVGPGTPAGELFRRYWQPVGASCDLDEEPVTAVRILGEDLVLYRDGRGQLGLLEAPCAHRKVSLAYGIPEEEGLRCCYHGWLYDHTGACLEQPAEAESSRFKERIRQRAYPVRELGGVVFAYLGPHPAPELPNFDVFVWEDAWRDVGRVALSCNWLQCVENFVDLMHVDYLHGRYYDYALSRKGEPPLAKSERVFNGVKQVEMAFERFELGITKRRRLENMDDNREWKVGKNPVLFPAMMRAGGRGSFQMAVPVDDTHTVVYLYSCYRPDDGAPVPPQARVPRYDVPLYDEHGRHTTDWVTGQDIMAWTQQGEVTDRTSEQLAASDQGIVFYRQVLAEEIDKVAAGEDPLGVLRDPAANVLIRLQDGEDGPATSARFMDNHWHRYSPIYSEAKALLERHRTVARPAETAVGA